MRCQLYAGKIISNYIKVLLFSRFKPRIYICHVIYILTAAQFASTDQIGAGGELAGCYGTWRTKLCLLMASKLCESFVMWRDAGAGLRWGGEHNVVCYGDQLIMKDYNPVQ